MPSSPISPCRYHVLVMAPTCALILRCWPMAFNIPWPPLNHCTEYGLIHTVQTPIYYVIRVMHILQAFLIPLHLPSKCLVRHVCDESHLDAYLMFRKWLCSTGFYTESARKIRKTEPGLKYHVEFGACTMIILLCRCMCACAARFSTGGTTCISMYTLREVGGGHPSIFQEGGGVGGHSPLLLNTSFFICTYNNIIMVANNTA